MGKSGLIKTFVVTALCAAILPYGVAAQSQGPVGPGEQKIERGGKVIVRGRTGHIRIAGWDKNIIHATAAGDRRGEQVSVRIYEEAAGTGVWIVTPDQRAGGDLVFEVKLPRYAEVKLASLGRGEIEIAGLDGAVAVQTGSGDLTISKVGSVRAVTGSGGIDARQIAGNANLITNSGDIQVASLGSLDARTHSGDVTISSIAGPANIVNGNGDISAKDLKGNLGAKALNGDIQASNVEGLVTVTATSGSLTIDNAGGDVRASTAAGDISINCAKGQVDAGTASGSITMAAVDGNVDAKTASGVVVLRTAIRAKGRYYLESLSGEVRMLIQGDPPGFTATLSTYAGSIETDFPLELDQSVTPNRRVTGRYRDGQARISLDTFSGTVKLGKLAPQETKTCK